MAAWDGDRAVLSHNTDTSRQALRDTAGAALNPASIGIDRDTRLPAKW